MNGCATCKHACFDRTKHRTPRLVGPGRCDWPAPKLALPIVIAPVSFNKTAIWPDYTECPTWEAGVPKQWIEGVQ